MKLFRRGLLLPLVLLLGALVAACVTSGPQKALNDVADALNKNDGAAFLAQIDMKPFATNQIKNMTREDQALNALDSMGRCSGWAVWKTFWAALWICRRACRSSICAV